MSDLLGPMQVILVTSRAMIEQFGKRVEKDDVETLFWHMPVSKEELLYAISVPNNKYIVNLIKTSGVFAVNFLPSELSEKVHKCNLEHGEHVDKFVRLGLKKIEADSTECPILNEACAYLECNVVNTIEFKDYTLFIAKIINSKVNFTAKRLYHIKKNIYTTTEEK